MDLYAYTQISTINDVAEANGIEVPRLRGYRIMAYEEKITKDEIADTCEGSEVNEIVCLCKSVPFWNPNAAMHSSNSWTDYLKSYYITDGKVRWDRIHGWKRRIAKFEIKKTKRKIKKQYEVFNKYVGRSDVLYIHARIGGNNWTYFDGDRTVAKEPWFLEKVDDWYDSTYCDIYAKIDPKTLKLVKEEEKKDE